MCGIAAAIGWIDAEVRSAVTRMNDAQYLRGPDAQGRWCSTPDRDGFGVDLAFRRLKIIDLSAAGDQPMVDSQRGNVMIFNGEIYNFKELRKELQGLGHEFRSNSDTEVILRGYAQWGDDCIRRLRGMHGLVIWDPIRRRALVARDRLGIKPVYWARIRRGSAGGRDGGGETILIASTVRALLASGLVPKKLDEAGVASYLWNGFVSGPGTIIEDVRQLAAGEVASIDPARAEMSPSRFWTLPRTEMTRKTADVAKVRAALEQSVTTHLVSDVPLGIFLSGGKDSSAVAALAVRGTSSKVKTFTITFEEEEYDESRYARQVANALGTEHHEVPLRQRDFAEHLDDALASLDQPTFDAVNSYFVSRAVRLAGLTVAVAGTGGDELFGGYRSFRDIPRARRWARRLATVPMGVMEPAAGAVARLRAGSFGPFPPQTRWGRLADALGTRGRAVPLYQVAYSLFTRRFIRQLDPHAGAAAPYGLSAEKVAYLDRLVEGRSELEAISALELDMFLGERLLRDTDAASMEVSLEARVPLVDHELVEALFELDDARRFEPVRSKSLLSELALKDIPPEVFDRPKRGFELPLDSWCRRDLRGPIGETLLDESRCRDAGLQPGAVARLWRAYKAGAPGLYWSRIWGLYVLLWWCRRHGVSAERR